MVCNSLVDELLLLALHWQLVFSLGMWKRGHVRKPRLAPQSKRGPKTPKPFTGLTKSLPARPVSRPWSTTIRLCCPHRPCSPLSADAPERSPPPSTTVPRRPARIMAGWAGVISAPMAIPGVAPGGSCSASSVRRTSSQPMGGCKNRVLISQTVEDDIKVSVSTALRKREGE
jgi:hypothetical protein